ncbi:MAG: alpha/beta fold hydrolase [Myxococcota bacterium]
MSGAPSERFVEIGGPARGRARCRIWEKGDGEPLFYLPGIGGLPRWTPALDRLAARRRVVAVSLPGFPGSSGHDQLDTHLDWIAATLELLDGAGLDGGDLVGVSLGATLAAEVAALGGSRVRSLVLAAPFGVFDPAEPTTDVFGQRAGEAPSYLCRDPGTFGALTAPPEGADPVEWPILQARAGEAAARLLWPLGDTGVRHRLHQVTCPTLVVWGDGDRILPASYAKRFASAVSGPAETATIPDAGHLVDLDAPDAFAGRVLRFLGAASGSGAAGR